MKFIKYLTAIGLVFSLTSCLKSRNDIGGLLTDEGSVLTSINDAGYIAQANTNLGASLIGYANFDISTLPNESVKFFTLHVTTPRNQKLGSPMTVKIRMSAPTTSGYTMPPASAITLSDVTVPAFSGDYMDVPVKFTVNKSSLSSTTSYGAVFTISSVSQGAINTNEGKVEVLFTNSKYTGRYKMTYSVVDSLGNYGATNYSRTVYLFEAAQNQLALYDFVYSEAAGGLVKYYPVNALKQVGTTVPGTVVNIASPLYQLDASGKLVNITNSASGASYSFSPGTANSNTYIYTSNDTRNFSTSYVLRITTGGVTRPFTFTETFTYDPVQAFF